MLRRTARGIHAPTGAALVAVLSLGGLAAVDAANSPAAQAIGQDTFTNPLAPDTAIEFHDGQLLHGGHHVGQQGRHAQGADARGPRHHEAKDRYSNAGRNGSTRTKTIGAGSVTATAGHPALGC